MSELILWKNREMVKMREDIDRLINRMWSDFGKGVFPFGGVSIDVTETKESIILKAELPGVDLEDVKISVANQSLLTLQGEKREEEVEESSHFHRVERRFGSFSRTIPLPCRVEVEGIKATYKKGILTVNIPKCKPEEEGIKVEVK